MNRMKLRWQAAALSLSLACAGNAATFDNPVMGPDWPDPTVWNGGDGWYYSTATPLRELRRSRDLAAWQPAGDPLTPAARLALTNLTHNVWAPSVTKVGGKWNLYVSLYVNGDADNRIHVLQASRPQGPFEHVGNVIDGRREKIRNAIDPFVTVVDGRAWMFFGSDQDGIHRVELTPDGTKIKAGCRPVHVAGRRYAGHNLWGKPGAWEGSYVFRRGKWWYLLASGGKFTDGSYHLVVGRGTAVDGAFFDREGHNMTEALAKPILASAKGDRFTGPGHNGDIFTDRDGRDWIFFHAHDTRLGKSDRPTLLQQLRWTEDGWPFFEGGKAKPVEQMPGKF